MVQHLRALKALIHEPSKQFITSLLELKLDPLSISNPESYTKTLGIEWNSTSDRFRLTVTAVPQINGLTNRALVSDIAKVLDVLGWYSPTVVKAKTLLQLLWSERIGWDDSVPQAILQDWL